MAVQTIEGGVPPENVFGSSVGKVDQNGVFLDAQYGEDLRDDVIREIQAMVGSAEIGLARSYIEEVIGDRMYTDRYKTYPYVILGIGDHELVRDAFRTLVNDVRIEVDRYLALGFQREQLMVVWRMNEKIQILGSHCRKCGGSTSIRARLLVKPDRFLLSKEALVKDPARR